MFASLVRLLGWGYIPISLIAKLPFAMSVVAVMTVVAAVRGSYAEAGATAGLVGVGTAVSGPLMGAVADRWGQRRVLLVLGVTNAAALLGLAWALVAAAPTVVVLLSGLAIGLTAPQATSMVRSRWLIAIETELPTASRGRAVSTALSYESMTDELMFVFGPVVVGVAALLWGTVSPILGAAALTAVGITAFALHRSAAYSRSRGDASAGTTARAVDRPVQAPAALLFRTGVLLPMAGMVCIGLFFGSTLMGLTAFMETVGDAGATGILYGVMGVGSAVCALAVVLLPEAFRLSVRWLVFALLILAGCLLFGQATSLPVFIVALLVMGAGVGPALVTLFTIASEQAPRGRLTTVMAMMTTGIMAGQSAAAALSGTLLDGVGLAVGLWAPAVAAVLLLAFGIAFQPVAARQRRSTPAPHPSDAPR
ncbi:MAG TPA: MFS transporter [Microbacteriaceae bacterium]|nr:MFS transporter [Microbacteriaceae bacterium]